MGLHQRRQCLRLKVRALVEHVELLNNALWVARFLLGLRKVERNECRIHGFENRGGGNERDERKSIAQREAAL